MILCLSICHQIYQRVSKDLMAFGIKALVSLEMGAGAFSPLSVTNDTLATKLSASLGCVGCAQPDDKWPEIYCAASKKQRRISCDVLHVGAPAAILEYDFSRR